MDIEKQNNWPFRRKSALTLLLCFIFCITGCRTSYEEQRAKQAKEEEKHKELIRKKKERIKALFDQISKKYNSSPFPPDDWEGILFTYELQRLSHTDEERTILFKGYLEDIEKTERGIIVEFLCLLGDLVTKRVTIRFRLTATKEKLRYLLSSIKREDYAFLRLRYLDDPDYFVVAKIADLRKLRLYELDDSDTEEKDESDYFAVEAQNFVSTGELVEAIRIPND